MATRIRRADPGRIWGSSADAQYPVSFVLGLRSPIAVSGYDEHHVAFDEGDRVAREKKVEASGQAAAGRFGFLPRHPALPGSGIDKS